MESGRKWTKPRESRPNPRENVEKFNFLRKSNGSDSSTSRIRVRFRRQSFNFNLDGSGNKSVGFIIEKTNSFIYNKWRFYLFRRTKPNRSRPACLWRRWRNVQVSHVTGLLTTLTYPGLLVFYQGILKSLERRKCSNKYHDSLARSKRESNKFGMASTRTTACIWNWTWKSWNLECR